MVDDDDFERLSRYKWTVSNSGYARRSKTTYTNGRRQQRNVYMHKEVYGYDSSVDHINRDKLDNRKSNLRYCTLSQNQANRVAPKTNTSGYKGVCYEKRNGKWRAHIRVNGKQRFLGYFDNPEAASMAYTVAAQYHFGEFALK